MKMPEFSKEAMQRFFLNHAEKLVIAISVAGLGALAWLGWSSPTFRDKTPVELSNMAVVQAEEYMNRRDSWQQIEAFRKLGIDPAAEVSQKTSLDPGVWTMASLVGPLVKTAEMRKDPPLVPLQVASVELFTAPVLLSPAVPSSRIGELALPGTGTPGNAPGGDPGRGVGPPGPGGAPGSSGGAGLGDGGGGGGRGGGGAGGAAAAPATVDRKIPGDRATDLHRREFVGVRGYAKSARGEAFLMDFCQISATISLEDLERNYKDTLMGSRAWFPRRDKPALYRVDVERQMEGESVWTSISDKAIFEFPRMYGVSPVAEIAPPDVFHSQVTNPLPPITDFDYRQLQTRAGRAVRSLRPSDLFAEITAKADRPRGGNPFGEGDAPSEDKDETDGPPPLHWLFGSRDDAYLSDKVERKQVLVRLIDLNPPKQGRFRYRVRVWIEDPNNTQESLAKNAKYFASHFNPPSAAGEQFGGGAAGIATGGSGGSAMSDGGNNDRGSGGGSGSGASGADKDDGFEFEPIADSDLDPAVRTRLLAQKALRDRMIADAAGLDAAAAREKTKNIWQTFCRPTDWAETGYVSVNQRAGRARVALGMVQVPRSAKIGELEFARDEPVAQLAASAWSSVLGAWVPAYRQDVRRGESLNYRLEFAHILNLVDFVVHRLEKGKTDDPDLEQELHVRTDNIVVDISGGRVIKVATEPILEFAGQKDARPYAIPSEMLLMDSSGNLRIHSEFEDLQAFRNALFIDDETNTYGRARAPEAEEPAAGPGR